MYMLIIGHNIHRIYINLLTATTVVPPSNASKWQMGFNSAFKGLNIFYFVSMRSMWLPFLRVTS